MSNRLLKALPSTATKYLTTVFNSCVLLSYFPKDWKIAKVVAICKPGKAKDNPNSYRPISLLSTISKIFEKLIKERLLIHIEDANIYPKEQFGFRAGHSTSHQILRIKNHIKSNLNSKLSTGLVLLDIEKAFDTVWHQGLIYKLIMFNFPTYLIKLIQSFLLDRKFAVYAGSVKSSFYVIASGVPQGSVLGPILFNVYVSDLPSLDVNTKLAMFADDTALYSSSVSPQSALQSLQGLLNILETFFHKWKIKANAQKSQAIWFTRRRKPEFLPQTMLQLNSVGIAWSESCKYLGLTLDKKLTFDKHIASTIN